MARRPRCAISSASAFPAAPTQASFYVADVDAHGPAVDGSVHVDIEDEDFAIVFPLKTGERVRLVGILRDGTDPQPRDEL